MEFPQPGASFAERFQLHEKLGEGGFASVFRATEVERPGDDLAVKIIRFDAPDGYSSELLARFEREVTILSQLTSPHIVRLRAHGQSSTGFIYMAFDYVPGRDLSDVISDLGRLEPPAVVSLLRQLLAAVEEAHVRGLVHRDIKPQNVRVIEQPDGSMVARLLDFGIAKDATSSSSITATGALVGTPRYMSPEQLRSEPLGPASDIYSLGMLAFEMLGGHHALPGGRLSDQFERMMSGYVFSIPDIERIGPRLLEVLNRMTVQDADARYASASSVIRALDRLDSPTPTPPPDVEATGSRTQVALLAVLVLVGVAFALAMLVDDEDPVPTERSDVMRADGLLRNDGPASAQSPPDMRAPNTDVSAEANGAAGAQDNRSLGCGQQVSFDGVGTLVDRELGDEWVVRLPDGYDPERPRPMIVLFHHDGGDGRDIIRRTGFGTLADEHQIILVAPPGEHSFAEVDLLGRWGDAAWRLGPSIKRARVLIQRTMEQLCVDRDRIFLVGHGSGGFAVDALSCDPWVAGIAMNAYRLRQPDLECEPDRPLPTLKFSVMRSENLPAGGGKGCGDTIKLAVADDEQIWRTRNNCSEERSVSYDDGGHTCHRWTCDKPLELCRLDGGVNWPGSNEPDPVAELGCEEPLIDFGATAYIWNFFDELQLAPREPER